MKKICSLTFPGSLKEITMCPGQPVNIENAQAATGSLGALRYRFEVCYTGGKCDTENWRQSHTTSFETPAIATNTTNTGVNNFTPQYGKTIKWVRRIVYNDEGCNLFNPEMPGTAVKRYKEELVTYANAHALENSHLTPGSIGFTGGAAIINICLGGSTTILSLVSASGGPEYLAGIYQWQISTNGGGVWSDISGATSSAYSPANVTANNLFRRKYTKSCAQTIINHVEVNVVTPAPGTINDANGSANRSICHNTTSGNINSITGANADGLTIGYLWQRSLNAGGTWADVGASSVDYNPGTLTNTTYYRRGARINQSGCPIVYTQIPVIIEVFEPHQQGSITIQTPAVCPGTSGNKITGTAQTGGNPSNSSYRWQSSTDGTSGWTNYPGTARDLTLSHQTVTGFYRRADDAGCGTKYTNVVGAAVFADLTAGSITGTQTVCQGTRPAILASSIAPGGGSGNFTYRWEKSNDGMTGWTAVSGALEITYHPPVLATTTYFRRVVIVLRGIGTFTNKLYGSEILKANVVAVNLLTGIDRIIPDQGISMYPNPVTDYFFIGTEEGTIIKRVSIFDISGSLVKAENGYREKINVSELPKGIYMIKIELDNRVIVKKLVKQ